MMLWVTTLEIGQNAVGLVTTLCVCVSTCSPAVAPKCCGLGHLGPRDDQRQAHAGAAAHMLASIHACMQEATALCYCFRVLAMNFMFPPRPSNLLGHLIAYSQAQRLVVPLLLCQRGVTQAPNQVFWA